MPLEFLVPSADHDVALRQPCAEARVESDPGDPELRQPPPDIAPEGPLRKRGEPVTDGDVDVAGLGKLKRDLTAGVCSPNDEDGALGKALGVSVLSTVQLDDARVELRGDFRGKWLLERTGRHNDLLGLDPAACSLGHIALVGPRKRSDLGVETHRQLELGRVVAKKVCDVVLVGVGVERRGKRLARQAVVLGGCE